MKFKKGDLVVAIGSDIYGWGWRVGQIGAIDTIDRDDVRISYLDPDAERNTTAWFRCEEVMHACSVARVMGGVKL